LKGGLMQRPERVVLVGITALLCGIVAKFIGGDYKLYVKGIPFHVFETISIFTIPISAMAVLTNITAIRRLTDAKKAFDEKEKMETKKTNAGAVTTFVLLAAIMFAGNQVAAQRINVAAGQDIMDTFPVPPGNPNQLFYLQRTSNKNTIVCDLNMVNGILNKAEPVHVYWIRYSDQGQRQELSYIQRTFAYGIQAKALNDGNGYEMHFVSSKKHPFYLVKSATDNRYNVYTMLNSKKVILKRIFIKINGGSFWMPKVEYVEIRGVDAVNGKEITDRLKI
jgi:hypothetical protein